MKFDRTLDQKFLKNTTILSMYELLVSRDQVVQDIVNNTKEDHRFFQGYLRCLHDLEKLIAEATNKS